MYLANLTIRDAVTDVGIGANADEGQVIEPSKRATAVKTDFMVVNEVASDYDMVRPMKSISFADEQSHNRNISLQFADCRSKAKSKYL